MAVVNPTEAKEIAIDFLKETSGVIEPRMLARVIKQVKKLMEEYSVDEIRYAISFNLNRKSNIYSFGYIEASIHDVINQKKMREKRIKDKETAEKLQQEAITVVTSESEVTRNDETSERNRRKAERFGANQRVRRKSYFDLFEGR